MNFEQFTVDNGAIRDLNELLFTSVFNDPDLERVVTPMTKVENGKKLGYVDRMGDVGVPGGSCNPTYTAVEITGFVVVWSEMLTEQLVVLPAVSVSVRSALPSR